MWTDLCRTSFHLCLLSDGQLFVHDERLETCINVKTVFKDYVRVGHFVQASEKVRVGRRSVFSRYCVMMESRDRLLV
jgi:hypothetical protein